jgi:PKD repeat protein
MWGWILETVTGEHRYQRLRARIRSADPASALAVRIQTDEVNKPFLQLVLLPTGGANPLSAGKDYAYGLDAYLGATHKVVADAYVADDEWYDVDLDLAEACAPLPTYQVMSARAFGDLELERLVVYDPEWLIPEFDTAAPVAFFLAVADELEVAFIDESAPALGTTITAWLWDFGDSMTSTGQNPTHVYSLTGGKSVTLTVTGSNGRQATYSRPIKVAINADGPLGVSMPVTESGFTATGLMPPRHSWRGDVASGNLVDSIGSMTLTASLITDYQQATGIAGWTRTGVRFTETNSQRIRTTAGPDASTVETLLVMVVFLQTPNAVRNIASLGSNIDVRYLSSGKLRETNGTAGNQPSGWAAVYDGGCADRPPQRRSGHRVTRRTSTRRRRAPLSTRPEPMGFRASWAQTGSGILTTRGLKEARHSA